MALYPQSFLDDLRLQADIVTVVQDVVALKRVGNRYRGLCPFHGEKTPSFHVNREQGLFHCFGCQVGGNVFKFVELHERVSFPEAVKLLAQRFGLPLPEMTDGARDPAADSEREALLKIHELATALYREALAGANGRRGRQMLEDRGLTAATIDRLQLGFAPPGRDLLARQLRQKGFELPLMLRSGLVMDREGTPVDRFRNRLMIPIAREGGSIVAFGGRSMDAETQPKYLNSPETPIYSKGRTLYGLNLTKGDVRRLGYAVLVEGYFDFAQVLQEGASAVVATCGTALTPAQVQLLRRFAAKTVLSFDPDAAGQGAAVRSCELLVEEGFQVSVAVLPAGEDPDTFIKRHGGAAYQDRLRAATPYLDFLLERAAAQHGDLRNAERRLAFLNDMLAVAARIPSAAARDQFADRLAHRADIGEEVVRDEIRKAAVARKPALTAGGGGAATGAGVRLPGFGEVTPAERDLLAGLLLEPERVMDALEELDDRDLQGLSVQAILARARELVGQPPETIPATLLGRLNEGEVALMTGIAARIPKPAPAHDCVRALRQRRYERERAAVQREIDRLQERGTPADDGEIDRLWEQKLSLSMQIEALSRGGTAADVDRRSNL
jgi:DNA primase